MQRAVGADLVARLRLVRVRTEREASGKRAGALQLVLEFGDGRDDLLEALALANVQHDGHHLLVGERVGVDLIRVRVRVRR